MLGKGTYLKASESRWRRVMYVIDPRYPMSQMVTLEMMIMITFTPSNNFYEFEYQPAPYETLIP